MKQLEFEEMQYDLKLKHRVRIQELKQRVVKFGPQMVLLVRDDNGRIIFGKDGKPKPIKDRHGDYIFVNTSPKKDSSKAKQIILDSLNARRNTTVRELASPQIPKNPFEETVEDLKLTGMFSPALHLDEK
tara:strand:+ start:892 stop:1281 length:390 start_codon:yes stop_codon:yes gene_type:complete